MVSSASSPSDGRGRQAARYAPYDQARETFAHLGEKADPRVVIPHNATARWLQEHLPAWAAIRDGGAVAVEDARAYCPPRPLIQTRGRSDESETKRTMFPRAKSINGSMRNAGEPSHHTTLTRAFSTFPVQTLTNRDPRCSRSLEHDQRKAYLAKHPNIRSKV